MGGLYLALDGEGLFQLVCSVCAVGFPLLMTVVAFFVGRSKERRHYAYLEQREREYANFMVTNTKRLPPDMQPRHSFLCVGAVVMGSDNFKRFVAGFRQLIGGRMTTLETVLERARREAVIRMLDEARGMGADAVFNVRIETACIGGSGNQNQPTMAMAEVVAYGTGVRVRRQPAQ